MVIAPARTPIETRIASATLAAFPVVARRELRRAGIHRDAIARRVADGRLREIWTDTFLVGIDLEAANTELIRAAAVTTPPGPAALDGVSALHRRGLWSRHDGSIHVVSRHSRRSIPDRHVTFRRSGAFTFDPVDSLPTRIATEALLAAAELLTPHQLANVIKAGQYSGDFTLEQLDDLVVAATSRRWIARVRRAIRLRRCGSAGTKSRSEDRFLPYVTAAFGEPLVNVFGAAGIPDYEPDMCWPDRHWIVEIDGGHHDDPDEQRKDRQRDAVLRAAGWTVVRVHWRRVWSDPVGVVQQLRQTFAG